MWSQGEWFSSFWHSCRLPRGTESTNQSIINNDGRNYIFLQLSVSNSYNFISKYKNAIEVVPFTCVYDPGDVNVGEPVGELVDIDNAVEVLAVELVANLPLDPLVLGSDNKSNIIEQQFWNETDLRTNG